MKIYKKHTTSKNFIHTLFHFPVTIFVLFFKLLSLPLRLLPHRLMQRLNSTQRLFTNMLVAAVVLIFGVWIIGGLLNPDQTKASWFNGNWSYRKAIPVTSNYSSTQSNVFVSFSLDTASLISAGKLLPSCNDLRITDTSGKVLKYHIGRTNACNNAATTIDFLAPALPTSKSTYYVYYGNPQAPSTDAGMYLSNIVTGSGNEITDATRSAAVSGDFQTFPDSSYGIWESRINLAKNSEQFNQGTWTKTGLTISADAVAGPNGTTTADKLVEDSSTGAHSVAATGLLPSGTNITASIYAKAAERTIISLGGNNNGGFKFDLSNGTVLAGTGTITSVGNGWYRLTANYSTGGAGGSYFIVSDGTGSLSYTGDGTSGVYVWGGQVELNRFSSPYIPTGSVVASRNGSRVQVPASLENATQGWVATRVRMDFPSTASTSAQTTVGWYANSNNAIAQQYQPSLSRWETYRSGVTTSATASASTFTYTGGEYATIISTWTASQVGISVNGSAFTTQAQSVLPTGLPATIDVGSLTAGTNLFNGDILWSAGGTGTLSDTDAATINNFGNADPTPTSGFGQSAKFTYVWNANFMEAINYIVGSLATEEQAPGPTAYWKFDEGQGTSTSDSSNNGNNGTLTNMSATSSTSGWLTPEQCISVKCLGFDGVNDYVNVQDSAAVSPTTAITVGAWINGPLSSQISGAGIISKDISGAISNPPYALQMNTSGQVSFLITNSSNGNTTMTTTSPLSNNTWHYVVGTYDGTTMKMYVDGILNKSTSVSGDIADTTGSLKIGQQKNAANRWFKGKIDDVKIYSYARSSTQVQADYTSRGSVLSAANAIGGTNNSALSNGLISYYKFDEASYNGNAGEVIDSSGNANNGIAINSAAATSSAKFGNAGGFTNASSQYIDAGDINALDGASQITLSAWVNPKSLNDFRGVISKSTNGASTDRIYMSLGGSGAGANTGVNVGIGNGTNAAGYTTSGIISTNTWHLWTMVYDGTKSTNNGRLRFFLDGIEQPLTYLSTIPATTASTAYTVKIGQEQSTRYWDGYIDEARIYNRPLSPDEVAQLYSYAPGPVAYYNFEQRSGTTVNDLSGNGNTATWNGTGSHWTQGKYGKAANFNGTNDYLRVNTGTILSGATDYTISFWMNAPVQAGNFRQILSGPGSGNPRVYFAATGQTGIYGRIGGTTESWITTTGSTDLTGRWDYVTLTVDSSGSQKAYVNGTLVNTRALSDHTNLTLSDLYIGSGSGPSNYLKGALDEFKIYNYVRTPGQVVQDMNAAHPLGGSPVGSQVGYWKFDEGFGTIAHDSTPNHLDGTLSGMSSPPTSTSGWQLNGKFGRSLGFNKGSTVVSMGNPAALQIRSDMTISAWIYPTVYAGTNNGIVSKYSNTNGNRGYNFGLNGSGKPTFRASVDGTATVDTTAINAVPLNTWSYVSVVYDSGAGSASYYINGILDRIVTGLPNSLFNPPARNFQIGTWDSGTTGSNAFAGLIDEVKIYNAPLTASDIRIDYNHGSSLALGSMSNTTGLTGGSTASNSAGAAYCIPGDTTSCSAPAAEWKFEEHQGTTANDTTGNGNTGTLNSVAWAQGKVGGGTKFNGSSSYVNIADANSLDLGDVWTIEARAKRVGGFGNTQYIMQKGSAAYSMEFNSSNQLILDKPGTGTVFSSTASYTDSNWHYFVFTKSGGTFHAYDNGVEIVGTLSNQTFTDNSSTLSIGANSGGSGSFFNGYLDEVRLFNYARTPAQVAYDYNRGKPIAWYKMDECQGATINDSSGNGLTGTITIGASGTQTAVGTCTTSSTAWGNGAIGKFNSSLNFDGTDDYVTMGDPANGLLDFGIGDFSVSYWAKYISIGAGGTRQVSKRPSSAGAGWSVGLATAGQLFFRLDDGTNSNETTFGVGSSKIDSTWHYFTFVFKRGSNLEGYIDGILNSTVAISTINGSVSNSSNFNLNNFNNTGNAKANVLMDDVQVFNYSLTQSQLQNLMNQSSSVRFGPAMGTP